MCRNMWPYINPSEYEAFASRLYEKLAPNSIVVLGYFDFQGDSWIKDSNLFPKILGQAGFKCSEEQIGTFYIAPNLIFEKN